MKRLILIVLFIFLPLLCVAQKFKIKVVAISDGDSFTGINIDNLQIKFRVYGIDAPEKKQAYGKKAQDFLSSLIFGKTIFVDVQSQDTYGRYIAYTYTPEGKDVSLLMLHEGMAWHFKKYDTNEIYSEAERRAKAAKRGLWVDSKAIAPWDLRAQRTHKK